MPSTIKWVGEDKMIEFDGRLFAFSDEAAEHVAQADWAKTVLQRPAVIYPNGKGSHEVAGDVLDAAEDGLLEHWRVRA